MVPVVLSDIPAHRTIVECHDGSGRVVTDTPSVVKAAVTELADVTVSASLPSWKQAANECLLARLEK